MDFRKTIVNLLKMFSEISTSILWISLKLQVISTKVSENELVMDFENEKISEV
jgi:hypothetical protein